MADQVRLDVRGGIAEIILDAPSKNSLDRAAIESLHRSLEQSSVDPSVPAVIITGANGSFCGGRVRDLSLVTKDEIGIDLAPILALNHLLDSYPMPVIAAVEGEALGFGFGLAVLSDLTVAADDANFALTELAHGIPPLIVLSYLYRYLPYKVAFDLAITGRTIDAEEARRLGLVTEVCASGSTVARAREHAEEIARLDVDAVGLLRAVSRRNASVLDEAAAADGAERIAELLASHSPHSPETR